MKSLNLLYAFLGGAIVGCSAAILFAPAKGEDVREKIREILRRKGIKVCDREVDELVAELSASVEK